jgi:hypothetical protein
MVISPNRITGLDLKRLLDDQQGRELDRLVLRGSCGKPSSIISSSRVRCEAGSLIAMRCSSARLAKALR